MPARTALVAGATGLIGDLLTDMLLESPHYSKVTLLLRREIDRKHPKLVQAVINFDQPDPTKIQGDDVFCCLGTTIAKAGSQEAFYQVDGVYPYEIGRIARQNGASQYLLVTALGADPKSRIFYNRVKGEVEEKISTLNFAAYCIFRPSLLLGERQEFRLGERIAQAFSKIVSGVMLGPLKKYKPVEARRVATAMLAAATRSLKGKHIFESDQIQQY